MLSSVFKPNRVASDNEDSSSSEGERVLPPGTPYLTKVNGKLVWARKKTPKPVNPVQDLLGEAFGNRAVIVRRRSKSLERPVKKVIIGTVPIVRPQPITYSAPLPQEAFPAMMPPMAYCPLHQPPHYPPQLLLSPMQQPGFQPLQSPRFYVPQQPLAPIPLFVQRSPTEKEKDQLKVFNAHFNNTVRPQSTRVTSASSDSSEEKQKDKSQEHGNEKVAEKISEATTATVKIAITKHVCGDCGRLRSRKYHHDHPLKPGEVPELAFCRKCQKDASSTSESSDSEEMEKVKKKKKKKPNKAKKAKAPRKKPVENSEDDNEFSDNPDPTPPKKPKSDQAKLSQTKNSAAKPSTTEEYIIVEEEFSDHEPRPRGRSQSRNPRDHEARRRPLSLLGSQVSVPRSRSRSYIRPSRQDNPKTVSPLVEGRAVVKENVQQTSPRIQYRYVEVVLDHESSERREQSYPRKVPIHFVDEVIYEKPASPKRDQQPGKARERGLYQAYSEEEPESISRNYHSDDQVFEQATSSRGPTSRHNSFDLRETSRRVASSRNNSFEEPETLSSLRSSDARRRRRRERAAHGMPNIRPWEQPHVIHPESDDDVVVVTETFEYRKKKQARDEEERRRQEYIDRATFDPRSNSQFSAEDAARYYHEDWSRAETEHVLPSMVTKSYQPYQPKPKKGYRRERHPESELTESEASYEYNESNQHAPPQAPTPPPPIYQDESHGWSGNMNGDWFDVTSSSIFHQSKVNDATNLNDGRRFNHYDWGVEFDTPVYRSELDDYSGTKHTNWGDEPQYSLSSESEHANRQEEVAHMPSVEIPQRQRRNFDSNARPAYIREATDGGTERGLI